MVIFHNGFHGKQGGLTLNYKFGIASNGMKPLYAKCHWLSNPVDLLTSKANERTVSLGRTQQKEGNQ